MTLNGTLQAGIALAFLAVLILSFAVGREYWRKYWNDRRQREETHFWTAVQAEQEKRTKARETWVAPNPSPQDQPKGTVKVERRKSLQDPIELEDFWGDEKAELKVKHELRQTTQPEEPKPDYEEGDDSSGAKEELRVEKTSRPLTAKEVFDLLEVKPDFTDEARTGEES